jgi:hypothetical protein
MELRTETGRRAELATGKRQHFMPKQCSHSESLSCLARSARCLIHPQTSSAERWSTHCSLPYGSDILLAGRSAGRRVVIWTNTSVAEELLRLYKVLITSTTTSYAGVYRPLARAANGIVYTVCVTGPLNCIVQHNMNL